ncbi:MULTISPECIES: glutamate-cysteine ligase family protein [unclassified Adlercreutzia]|uniref:glutamate-cysteine ligase family protein n=1 Tax=unclassified Adlercreutzia TaxID=2636013 RepID=UPI0013EC8A63|nr:MULTISPECIES: glutamate-cysteine ligase family protein [unclassified Adlercreutzia]
MTEIDQPARTDNIKAIVSFFESGIKDRAEKLGIELEHTLLHRDGRAVSYSEEHGTEWLLEQLSAHYTVETRDAEGDLLGVARGPQAVTIEPAAQVELSAGPFADLDDARACFEEFEERMARALAPTDVRVLTLGYHPTARAASLELIPKRRYELMNRYLGAISPFGVRMMRGSASTQVSLDYTSAEDCLRKLRLAFALTPVLSLLCDNSPVFEGAPRPHELMRTEIWKFCDPDRCGVVPRVMEDGFALEDYAAYILDAPAILSPDADEQWRFDERTFGEIYAEVPMRQADVEHALSMFFTDVRLKTYIEIRPADAMPVPYVIAYAALIKGLFYSARSLDALDELFAQVSATDIARAKESLMEAGYEGAIYGRPAGEVVDDVVRIAQAGLAEKDRAHLEPLAQLAAERTTLARLACREDVRA